MDESMLSCFSYSRRLWMSQDLHTSRTPNERTSGSSNSLRTWREYLCRILGKPRMTRTFVCGVRVPGRATKTVACLADGRFPPGRLTGAVSWASQMRQAFVTGVRDWGILPARADVWHSSLRRPNRQIPSGVLYTSIGRVSWLKSRRQIQRVGGSRAVEAMDIGGRFEAVCVRRSWHTELTRWLGRAVSSLGGAA